MPNAWRYPFDAAAGHGWSRLSAQWLLRTEGTPILNLFTVLLPTLSDATSSIRPQHCCPRSSYARLSWVEECRRDGLTAISGVYCRWSCFDSRSAPVVHYRILHGSRNYLLQPFDRGQVGKTYPWALLRALVSHHDLLPVYADHTAI